MIGCSDLVGTSQGQSIDAWQEVGHPFQLTPLHSVVHVRLQKGHIKKCCLRRLVYIYVDILFNFFGVVATHL